jgi:hypothetical protein
VLVFNKTPSKGDIEYFMSWAETQQRSALQTPQNGKRSRKIQELQQPLGVMQVPVSWPKEAQNGGR